MVLGLNLRHIDVHRLRVECELWLTVYATARWNLCHICELHTIHGNAGY